MAGSGDPSGTKPPPQPKWAELELLTKAEQQAFEILERQFNQVLYELQADPALDKFRQEYEKLHRALKKSHESEKRLIKKCRELNTEILTNTVKVKSALQNSEEDQLLITALKEEMHKAWQMVDVSQEKESKANEKIRDLKLEIERLNDMVDKGVEMDFSKDTEVIILEDEKQTAIRERDNILSTVTDLKAELAKWIEKVGIMEKEKLGYEGDLMDIKGELQAKKAECDREFKKKERLERDMRDVRTSLESCQTQLKQKEALLLENQEHIAKMETSLQEQKGMAERASKMLDALHFKVAKLQNDLEDQIHSNTQLLAENSSKIYELKAMEEELNTVREELIKGKKLRESTLTKMKAIEQHRDALESKKEQLQSDILQLEKEAEIQRKLTEAEKKRGEELARERDMVIKTKTEAEEKTAKHMDLIRIKETVIRNLEIEVQQYREKHIRQEIEIEQLEKAQQKVGEELAASVAKYLKALDDIQDKEFQIVDLQKKIEANQMHMKQQKAMFEAVRAEKNTYSKHLVETQDEINEIKRKLTISTQMVEGLKDQLSTADNQLEKGLRDIAKIEKDKEALNGQISTLQDKVREQQDRMAAYVARIDNHDFLMTQIEAEKARVGQEHDLVKSERDLLASQLVRKSEELQLVYEKIRVQQSTLEKGQLEYKDRVNELRVLKLKLNDYRREHAVLSRSVNYVSTLKRELYNVSKELTREKLKVKALSEELETPQNVHRWRSLMATNPPMYEMIVKVQALQKSLIHKTEEVVEKDFLVKEKEKLLTEMKSIMDRHPGTAAAEQLSNYSRKLLEKTHQLKAMSAELTLCQAKEKESRVEIHSLHDELLKLKNRYLDRKEKEAAAKRRENRSLTLSIPKLKTSALAMVPMKSAVRVGR